MERTTVTAALAIAATPEHLSARGRTGMIPPDALCFVSDLVHEGRNDNGDIFTRAEMEAAAPGLIWTPFDEDHIFQVAGTIGGVYDAVCSVRDGRAVIRIAGFIHRLLYPRTAWKVESGLITGVSMECVFARSSRVRDGRVLEGVKFIGVGLTRMPADRDSFIDRFGDPTLRVMADQRRFLLQAAVLAVA